MIILGFLDYLLIHFFILNLFLIIYFYFYLYLLST